MYPINKIWRNICEKREINRQIYSKTLHLTIYLGGRT